MDATGLDLVPSSHHDPGIVGSGKLRQVRKTKMDSCGTSVLDHKYQPRHDSQTRYQVGKIPPAKDTRRFVPAFRWPAQPTGSPRYGDTTMECGRGSSRIIIWQWLGSRVKSETDTLAFTKKMHRFLYDGESVCALTETGRASPVPWPWARSSSPGRPACDRRNDNQPFVFVFALTPQNGHNPTLILSAASHDA
jgi:hypothetical protein